MDAKTYFKLTAKTIDRQKTYFATRDANVKNESMALEDKEISEIIRVALRNKEIHDYIISECPWLTKKLQQAQQLNLF